MSQQESVEERKRLPNESNYAHEMGVVLKEVGRLKRRVEKLEESMQIIRLNDRIDTLFPEED